MTNQKSVEQVRRRNLVVLREEEDNGTGIDLLIPELQGTIYWQPRFYEDVFT